MRQSPARPRGGARAHGHGNAHGYAAREPRRRSALLAALGLAALVAAVAVLVVSSFLAASRARLRLRAPWGAGAPEAASGAVVMSAIDGMAAALAGAQDLAEGLSVQEVAPPADEYRAWEWRPKYHLYEPSSFAMYRNCFPAPGVDNGVGNASHRARFGVDAGSEGHAGVSDGFKHSVDLLFLQALLANNRSVPPEEADVFIVPALFSQSAHGFCGKHEDNFKDLIFQLLRSPYYLGEEPGAKPHVVLKDVYGASFEEFSQQLALPGVVWGRFEAHASTECCTGLHYRFCEGDTVGCFSVGYSTVTAVERARASEAFGPVGDDALSEEGGVCLDRAGLAGMLAPPLPLAGRKYRYSVAFHFDSRPSFAVRRTIAWAKAAALREGRAGHPIVSGQAVVHPYCGAGKGAWYRKEYGDPQADDWCEKEFPGAGAKLSCAETLALMRDSEMIVALPGDTPTSDRIWNAFDTLTLVGVLSAHFMELLDVLPFRWAVPWEHILVPINQTEWEQDPLMAPIQALDRLGAGGKAERLRLMAKHADDVSWARPESTRVPERILEGAWNAVQGARAFRKGRAVLQRRANEMHGDNGWTRQKRNYVAAKIRHKRELVLSRRERSVRKRRGDVERVGKGERVVHEPDEGEALAREE